LTTKRQLKFRRSQVGLAVGDLVSAAARDRVRALQLFEQALPLVQQSGDRLGAAQFYLSFANALLWDEKGKGAWRFPTKTDLTVLPDFEKVSVEDQRLRERNTVGGWQGAAVDDDGQPVYHRIPADWPSAASDGERWRWMLAQARTFDPARQDEIDMLFANFCRAQFGVQTLARVSRARPITREVGDIDGPPESEPIEQDEAGPSELASLTDDETIARLSTGIRRLTLPDEFNSIKLLRRIADRAPEVRNTWTESARDQLCQEYEDRRQYPRAVHECRQALADFGPGENDKRQQRFNQIIKKWEQFKRSQ
jgi:hypothetical protein